jgi:hypothetical protein
VPACLLLLSLLAAPPWLPFAAAALTDLQSAEEEVPSWMHAAIKKESQ